MSRRGPRAGGDADAIGLDRRRLLRRLAPFAAVQGALIVAQADLLARAIAALDPGPLPWLAGVVALRAGVSWVVSRYAAREAAALKADLRARLVRAKAGPTLVTKGVDALDAYLTGYLPQLAVAALVPALVLVRLGAADPVSALTVLVTLPLVPAFGILVGRTTGAATRAQWDRLNRLGGHFQDVLAGLSTLRAFDRTAHQETVVRDMAEAHRKATGRALRVAFLSALVLELVATLSVALVAVPVGLRLLDGGIGYRTALVVLLLAPEVYLPLRGLGVRFHAAAEGLAAASDAAAALARPAPDPRPRRRPAPEDAEIRLEGVTVRYGDRLALDRVSLVLRPGDRLVLTGPSGAGKSTLLGLLLGEVAPDEGRVLVGGTDLRDLDRDAWLRRVAWVPQAPHLFAESVARNIALGAPDASPGEVERAAREARAHRFIADLPDGYGTVLGRGGVALSAGQRQRIALARAFLRPRPIVLLDEPTARLDPANEAAVMRAVRRLLDGRTAVLAAHRPATLAAGARTVRLGGGRVEGEAA